MLGIGMKMVKKIFLLSIFGLLVGCAHRNELKPTGYDRSIKLERAGISPSFCFDGLMWKLLKSECKEIKFQNLGIGYTKYWCSDSNTAEETENPFQSEEFFIIALNRRTGKYVMPAPPDTLALCADSFGLLVTAPRD